MIKVFATKIRNNLFEYLNKIANGETIIIQGNNQEAAPIVSAPKADRHENMKVQFKLLVSPEEIIKPHKYSSVPFHY